MKQYFQNLFKFYCILALCSLHTFAKANTSCATQFTSNQANYILETQPMRVSLNVNNLINDTIQIPVVAHILEADTSSQDRGYPTIDSVGVKYALNDLNTGFSEAGFQFNLCSINEIPYSTSLKEIRYSIYDNSNEFEMAEKTVAARALNIYFVPEAIAPNGQSVCGWASFPAEYYKTGKNWIVIRNDCAANGNTTLIHEVGHFFNLYHTHQGKNPSLGITERELANGTNCGSTAGDGLCDTPAEPYMGGRGLLPIVNNDCDILCEYRDAKDNVYSMGFNVGDSVRYNYMSYAPTECRSRFTDEQIERMKKSYLVDRNYLSNLCPGVVSNLCDPFRDEKVLLKLYRTLGGPIPSDWSGVTFNSDGCVTSIDLKNAGLTGEIPIEIDDLNYLTTLNLSNNNICGTLPKSIGNITQLQILNLSNNQISGEIPVEIEGLTNLLSLNLSNNKLSDYIPYQLAQLVSLQELKLSGNDFGGCLHIKLDSFMDQGNLTHDNFDTENDIDICTECNRDDWDAIKQIYDYMEGKLGWKMDYQKVHDYFDRSNPPADCNLDTFNFLKLNNYGRVNWLKMDEFELTGQLTDTLTLLSDLETLILDNNEITGKVPSSFENFTKLQSLILEGNKMDTCLPVSMTKLCGQANISAHTGLSYNLWSDFCQGLGGYCEDVTDYVMPGDFNNDKKVNHFDLLYWSHGTASDSDTGYVRVNASTAWLPQYCENWNDSIWGVNKKHLDANGDGSICPADLYAFHQNFGKATVDQTSEAGPSISEEKFELGTSSDGTNGFYLSIKNYTENQNVQVLIFTIDLGTFSYQDAYFNFDGVENKPMFEQVEKNDETNTLEIALLWDENKPPPTGEDNPFGRFIIGSNDEGDRFSLIINNIKVLDDNILIASDSLKIAFDTNNSDSTSVCTQNFTLNDIYSGGYTFNASDSITSSGYITGCTNMNFNAGKSVILYPGFKTQHGVVFCAEIADEPCKIPKDKSKLSKSVELGIHPNPSKHKATLTFELMEASKINVVLTDIMGKPVMELLNNTNKEAGLHQINIDTSHLPVGMYYCTLKNKETISSQKLLVVN